jgi:putative Mg2+ transporter-C (MgtC) family protein
LLNSERAEEKPDSNVEWLPLCQYVYPEHVKLDNAMSPTVEWPDIALRLALAAAAGALVGMDRSEHGRPVGLRTVLLVSLAAAISMIQVNLLLATAGRSSSSFIMMDLMRLPLGILTGMGFIGGGAILRRDDMVVGVTTAATLWLVTVLGLAFGGGQLGLGIVGTMLGLVVLSGLKRVELRMRHDRNSTLTIAIESSGPTDDEIRECVFADGFQVSSWNVAYKSSPRRQGRVVRCQLSWRGRQIDTKPPEFIAKLAGLAGVRSLRWSA